MSLLVLAALSLVQQAGGASSGQIAAKRITVSTGLLSAERALAELSKATCIELRTSPMTMDLPLMIRVKDADSRTVLTKIADLLGAEWRQEGQAYILSSDSAFRAKLARQPDTRRGARFTERIQQQDALTRDAKFDAAYAQRAKEESDKMMKRIMGASRSEEPPNAFFVSSSSVATPAGRAVNALLLKIGAASLAALVPGERTVYALHPTRMQAALPPNSRAILETFLKDTAAYRQSMRGVTKGNANPPAGTVLAQGAIADAHLEIRDHDGTLTANLTLFDANGESLAYGTAFLQFPPVRRTQGDPGPALVVSDLGREWGAKLSAASGRLASVRTTPNAIVISASGGTAAERSGAAAQPMSAALKALLSDPEGSNLGAPLFEPVAAAISGDLIATVPDSGLATLAGIVANPGATQSAAITALESSREFTVVCEGTLTLVGASTPSQLHRSFADRAALRTLVKAIQQVGYLRLDDAARYAIAQRRAEGSTHLAAPIAQILQGPADITFSNDPLASDFEALRVYGSLTQAQQARLAAGGAIPFSALSADARDALARTLFHSPDGPRFDREERVSNAAFLPTYFSGTRGRALERTVRFTNGLPSQGYLTLAMGESEKYLFSSSKTGARMFGNSRVLGMQRGIQQNPVLRRPSSQEYDQFTPAKERAFMFKFVFDPEMTMMRSLTDNEVVSTTVLTYDQLPKAFRDSVESSAKVYGLFKAAPPDIRP